MKAMFAYLTGCNAPGFPNFLLLPLICMMIMVFIHINRWIRRSHKKFADFNNKVPTWPAARGTVTKSEFHEEYITDDSNSKTWEFDLEYEFIVGDRQYTSYVMSYFGTAGDYQDKDERERLLRKYAIGTAVEVRFDPGNPENCCLYQSPKDTVDDDLKGNILLARVMLSIFSAATIFCIIFVRTAFCVWSCYSIWTIAYLLTFKVIRRGLLVPVLKKLFRD